MISCFYRNESEISNDSLLFENLFSNYSVEMLKLSEVSEEEQNLAKIKESQEAPQQRMVVEGNEILNKDSDRIPGLKKHVTYDAVVLSKIRGKRCCLWPISFTGTSSLFRMKQRSRTVSRY